MITKDEIEQAENFLRETDPPPLSEANGASPAPCLAEDSGFTLGTAPVIGAGADISTGEHSTSNIQRRTPNGELVLPATVVLEAAAAQNADIGAVFARRGNRRAAREHFLRAIEQLNEAELE